MLQSVLLKQNENNQKPIKDLFYEHLKILETL